MSQTQKVSKNNTKISIENGFTIIRLYNTDIVKFNDKQIILNSGGYETVTTKTRMTQASNQYNLGYNVYQEKGKWYVSYNKEIYDFNNEVIITR